MKMFLSWILFSVLCVANSQLLPGYGYHEAVGIPKAEYVRLSESSVARIIGGTKVPQPTTIPYQAGIVITLTTGGTSICGGSLVSRTKVLTAAHCWFDGSIRAKQFTIVLGSLTLFSGGTRITTSNVVVHPSWNTVEITNDIAMASISSVNLNNNIQLIALPTTADINSNFAGMTAIASGYGKTSDAQKSFPPTTSLYSVNLNIISNAECQRSFEIPLHGSHLCTSGRGKVGTCDGDSGGPLAVVRNRIRTLVGIVSFGLSDACQSGYPSVYTRVTSHLSWIQRQI